MQISRIRNAILILALLVLLLGAVSVEAADLSGSGTAEDPYLIKTAADLAAMHDNLGAHYALDADIDLFGKVFQPVGDGTEGAFSGSLDGRGHTIRSLELDLPDNKYVGLFGYLEGSVSNLKLANVEIAGGRYVGAVAGNIGVGGAVVDCSVLSGSVSSSETTVDRYVGGVTGLCEGTLNRCTNAAAVSGGYIYSYSSGISSYAGGLAGKTAEMLELTGSSNSGAISGRYSGGLIGLASKDIRISDCSNSGKVSNGYYGGGLVGYTSKDIQISDCSNNGTISTEKNDGGLIAYAAGNARIENSTNTGKIGGEKNGTKGGIICNCAGTATITDCRNAGDVYGYWCGGIAYYLAEMELHDCRNEGDVEGECDAAGIVRKGNGKIFDCSNYGNARASGSGTNYYAAGILCEPYGETVIDGCANYGTISAYYQNCSAIADYVGRGNLTVKNCRNYGSAYYFSAGTACSGNLNYGSLSSASEANLSIGSGTSKGADVDITTLGGIALIGKTKLWCSDLRYRGSGGTGYSLSNLKNPESNAYIGWSLPGDWIILEGKNSGLPMPKEMADKDLMDETVLILEKGESRTLNAPFEARQWTRSSDAVRCDNGTVTAQNVGSAVVTAYDGTDRQARCVVFVYEKRSSLSLAETCRVSAGSSVQLTTDLPDDDPQGTLWRSSNTSVASVNVDGKVTGNKLGQAIITAELPLSGVSASCTVTVLPSSVTSIRLSQTTATLQCGKTLSLTFTTGTQNNDRTVTWSSSSDAVATVENGVVTGQTPGVAIITCCAASGVSATCTVTVTQPGTSLTLDQEMLTMELGTTAQLTARILPENTTDTVQWSSTDSSIVSVDGSGTLTAKGVGQAAVYAYTASGLKVSCSVTVCAQNVWPETVKFPQRIFHARIGQQIQLEAALTPENCNHTALTWTSSNTAVADVTVTGLVQTASAGTAEIRVTTENGLYDVCTVLVSETSSAEFVVESGRIPLDGTADTAVYLVKNPGISAFSIDVKYDAAKLEPVAVQAGELLASAGSLSSNVENIAEPGALRITWYSDADITADGTLFTVTWRALTADNSTAAIDLSYEEDDICNSEKNNVPVRTEAGSLLLLNCPVGDIYRDDEVNMKDIVYFARWFNKLETMTEEQELAADVYFDGKLDVKDLTALAQILSSTVTTDDSIESAAADRSSETESISEVAAISAFDTTPDPFCICVSDAAVDQNGEAEIVIRGEDCPGVAAFRFALNLPEGYEVLSVSAGELLSSGKFDYNKETRGVTWYATEDHVLNGELLTVRVKAGKNSPADAAAGISYLASDYFHAETYAAVSVTSQSGKLRNEFYFAVTGVEWTSDAIRITVKAAAERKVRIFVANYDEKGRMTGSSICEQTFAAGEDSCMLPVRSTKRSSSAVFFLDKTRNVPLCDKIVLPG